MRNLNAQLFDCFEALLVDSIEIHVHNTWENFL